MNSLYKVIFSDNYKWRISRHILFWLFFYCYFTSFGIVKGNLLSYIKTNAVVFPIDITAIYILLYLIYPTFLNETNLKKPIFYFSIFIIAYWLVTALSYMYILPSMIGNYNKATFFKQLLYASQNTGIVLSISIFIKTVKYLHKQMVNNRELERKNIENKMTMLTAQLHPHFLFNTLNNLYTLSKEKSEKTSEIIMKLSEVMRYILDDYDRLNVGLNKELETIMSYIEIEKLRYDDLKVNFDIHIQESVLNEFQIPPLLIFTFVENAFKHGVSGSLVNPWISIQIEQKDSRLKIYIENSIDEEYKINNREGLGLKNVQKRLDLYYPGRHRYSANRLPDRYKVFLELKV